MKSKFLLSKQDGSIVIEELSELDPGTFSSLSEKVLDREDLESASMKGISSVIEIFRDNNLFPPSIYAGQIAEAIIAMLPEGAETERELLFNDQDYVAKGEKVVYAAPEADAETSEIDIIDDMLAEDMDEDAFVEDDFAGLDDPENNSLKVADDEIGDMDIDV